VDDGGDRHRPLAGVGLRRGVELELAAAALGECSRHLDDAVDQVDVDLAAG
jgi:hypothetical protein